MTLRLIEGFENMENVLDHYLARTTNITFDTVVARSVGGTALKMANGVTEVLLPIPATDVLFMGFGFYTIDSTPSISWSFVQFLDDATEQCDLHLRTTGKLAIYRSTALLGETANAVISDNTWHYIELKITIANALSAGGISVKVDGVEVLVIDSGDSQAGTVAQCTGVKLIGHTNSQPRYDDLYICDDAGASNNTFLGQVYVKTLSPTGIGNTNNFVGADSDSTNNHLQVDDTSTLDDDTTYVESGSVNDIDQYSFAAMPLGTVHGVAVVAVARNTSAGDAVPAKPSIRSAGADYLGTEFYVGFGYMARQEVFETDPATSAQWLKAGVDAANFGLKITG